MFLGLTAVYLVCQYCHFSRSYVQLDVNFIFKLDFLKYFARNHRIRVLYCTGDILMKILVYDMRYLLAWLTASWSGFDVVYL